MTGKVVVLYEDSRAPETSANRYPLHDLVLASVGDRMGTTVYALEKRLVHWPLKGAGNVRKKLELGLVGGSGEAVFAVLDRDKIGDASAFPGSGHCFSSIGAAIRGAAKSSIRVRVTPVLLEQNAESVVDACCVALGQPRLARKPKPAERDHILGKVAYNERGRRDAVLALVPSLEYLVRKLVPYV
jgi:hypothetical protein